MRVQLTRPEPRTERGAVAVFVAILAVLLFGMAAFVVDFGMAYANKRQLQTAADAGVLAAAREVHDRAGPDDSCADIDEGTIDGEAQNEAVSYLGSNAPNTGGTVTGNQFSLTCEDESVILGATTGYTSSTLFGGLFNVNELTVSREARATVGPAGTAIAVRPFGICEDIAAEIIANPTMNKTVPIDNASLGCGYASGNWAMMDMNGGGNSTAEAKKWIEGGYEDPVEIDEDGVVINGDTGTPSPGGFDSAMNGILGTESVLPVFSSILTPSGNNADFVITSFIGVKLCGWKFNGQSGSATCFVSEPSMPNSYIQLRYARVIAVGELSDWCRLGDPTCDRGVRVVKLID